MFSRFDGLWGNLMKIRGLQSSKSFFEDTAAAMTFVV
jgi:hypothetical protein